MLRATRHVCDTYNIIPSASTTYIRNAHTGYEFHKSYIYTASLNLYLHNERRVPVNLVIEDIPMLTQTCTYVRVYVQSYIEDRVDSDDKKNCWNIYPKSHTQKSIVFL